MAAAVARFKPATYFSSSTEARLALNHGVEGGLEVPLIHVVLVLPDADGSGLDLDQLGERVLEAAGDGNRSPDRDVQPWKLADRVLGGAVNACSRLAGHHHRRALGLGQLLERHPDEALGLAPGRAVADGDELDLVVADHGQEGQLRPVEIVLRLEGEHRAIFQELARRVDGRDLAPGPEARIDAEHGFPPGRRGEEEVPQVLGEDGDRLGLGLAPDLLADLGLGRGGQQAVEGVDDGLEQEPGGGAPRVADKPIDEGPDGLVLRDLELDLEHLLPLSADEGQESVGRDGAHGLVEVAVHFELRRHGLEFLLGGGGEDAFLGGELAQLLPGIGVLGPFFGQDVAGALEGGVRRFKALVGEGIFRRLGREVGFRLGEVGQPVSQGLEPGFAGLGGARGALGLEGKVQVFELGLERHGEDSGLELRGQLALLADGVQDGRPPFVELPVVLVARGDGPELGFVEVVGLLLAVPGDERDRGAAFEQGERGGDPI